MISLKRFAAYLLAAGLFISGCASVNTYVVLLPEEGGAASAVTVAAGSQKTVLEKPYSVASVDTQGNIQSKAITAEEANRTFAAALAAQPPKPVSFTLYFETNSVEVTAASRPTLDALFSEVARRSAVEVQVTGHTDRVGTVSYNDALSLRRAERVRNDLVGLGIQRDRITIAGRGEREPIVQTEDEVVEPRNRRVEITVR